MSKEKLKLLMAPTKVAQAGGTRRTCPLPVASEATPHVAPSSKLPFLLRTPQEPCGSATVRGLAAGVQWVLFCRLWRGLPAPAFASNGLSCASDSVESWAASHTHCTLCSSCQGQTPILCLGPWGCGPNTTKTFFSVMNALSGGLAAPSQDGRGTRQRRKQPLVPHLLPGGAGVLPHPSEGQRAGEQVNGRQPVPGG